MKLILIVEDDEKLARTLEKGLKREGDYRVHHVTSAEDALEQTADHRYDTMIVDWLLPEMNGPELIEDLRDEGYATPILMLTVRDSVEDRVKGLESGADDYLTKPFSMEEVQARVRALLRRPAEWASVDEITVGPLTVNSAMQEAEAFGTRLDLRKKEFDLLRLLADREPNVVSRSVIAERVWGSEYVSDNSIDVTVSGLRKKLEDAKDGREEGLHLETVRGVGYRLMVEEEEKSQQPA
jgi:DNA-binding response OmpR family regulator